MAAALEWEEPERPCRPAPNEVHVWRVRLDAPPGAEPPWTAALPEDERRRADGFRVEAHRQRFLRGRGALRALLGDCLDLPPGDLRFEYGEHGKPRLPPPLSGGLSFNLSHSGELALVALASGREVGVDVEQTQREVAWEQVARRFFAAAEQAAIRALPAGRRREACFACWTRKEAYLKACGRGLRVGLSTFAVPLEGPGAVEADAPGAAAPRAGEWWVESVQPGAGYVGAVCTRGRGWRLRCLSWPAP